MTSFSEEGFLSDEVSEGRIRLQNHYESEFSICRKMNLLLMEMQKKLNPINSRKELISNIITSRFSQSLQSAIILLSYAINSDSHSIVRNMQEWYLALACVLKDEDYFVSINEFDEMKFKTDMIKFIEKSFHLKDLFLGCVVS